jgi:hypothetical protein
LQRAECRPPSRTRGDGGFSPCCADHALSVSPQHSGHSFEPADQLPPFGHGSSAVRDGTSTAAAAREQPQPTVNTGRRASLTGTAHTGARVGSPPVILEPADQAGLRPKREARGGRAPEPMPPRKEVNGGYGAASFWRRRREGKGMEQDSAGPGRAERLRAGSRRQRRAR